MVSRKGALPASLPLRARALRALARCDLLRTGKPQVIEYIDPAKNVKLIKLILLLLVHNDFNNNLNHYQKV